MELPPARVVFPTRTSSTRSDSSCQKLCAMRGQARKAAATMAPRTSQRKRREIFFSAAQCRSGMGRVHQEVVAARRPTSTRLPKAAAQK